MAVITAHSGCDGTKDNSTEFIRYALNSEADCMEADVRRNQAGALILSHNKTEEECVTLQEAFRILKQFPEKQMNCDLKEEGLEVSVYQLAGENGVRHQLIYSGEIDLNLLAEKEKWYPEVQVYINPENLQQDFYEWMAEEGALKKLEELLADVKGYPVSCINMEYHIYTDETIKLLAKMQVLGSAWTVNERDDIRRLLKKGLFNITTRNLTTALELKGEAKG
ncbi:glycerophosphodiester phosphodiesterase [Clostridium boliviensis]|uniref:Glycerophosphodiester phosphodiesterase n=1 Tax=Clostridium boliviensis TaxID=318465 RepID=A0ABU4GU29_9CLOT|nr:glycerophosphodiester phosphodiesterase [Clostridium boliviensis]MDW2799722.1 glycerophosphodiester phosphodiesterase [Clostridium boliviensis]